MKKNISESVIEQLRRLSAEERPQLLNAIYEKNRAFFQSNIPIIDAFLSNRKCPYRIDITEKFLNIIHEPTNRIDHPEAVDAFALMLGDWVHKAWVDLFNIRVATNKKYPLHTTPVERIFAFMRNNFPAYTQNYTSGRINLKVLEDGRRFSPPVVFLGVFHGLHIDYFFSRTVVPSALFIEPDSSRFEVSCYFLDYEAIVEATGGRVYFSLGENERGGAIQSFFNRSSVTPLIWARVLPAYTFAQAPVMIENLKMLQSIRTDIFYPLDLELPGLISGYSQIKKRRLLLSEDIAASSQCRIAVVATGPSLTNDLGWLKKNQEKVIIFAVHSSVRILRRHGITPDFQFSLDIHPRTAEEFTRLDLFKDKPMIQYYKASDNYFDAVDTVLMVAERGKPNPVFLDKTLEYTHPSTTCLAFSFADYCSPREIYLIGCDFGYRSTEGDHAKGSLYDTWKDEKGEKVRTHYGNTLQALMPSNFNNADLLQTTTFLSYAKMMVEMRIETSKKDYSVYNMSDGVAVRHALPRRSIDVRLPRYEKKRKDVDRIMRAFKRAEPHKNWQPYSEKGGDVLLDIKKKIIDRLSLERFSWIGAATALDRVLDEEIGRYAKKNDLRMDIYMETMAALLSAIYCCLLFHDSEEEAGTMFGATVLELRRIFDEDLFWPKELDERE